MLVLAVHVKGGLIVLIPPYFVHFNILKLKFFVMSFGP